MTVLKHCRYCLPEKFNKIFDTLETYIMTRKMLGDEITYREDTRVGGFSNSHWVKMNEVDHLKMFIVSISTSIFMITKREDSCELSINLLLRSEIDEIVVKLHEIGFNASDYSIFKDTFKDIPEDCIKIKFKNAEEFEKLFMFLEQYLS